MWEMCSLRGPLYSRATVIIRVTIHVHLLQRSKIRTASCLLINLKGWLRKSQMIPRIDAWFLQASRSSLGKQDAQKLYNFSQRFFSVLWNELQALRVWIFLHHQILRPWSLGKMEMRGLPCCQGTSGISSWRVWVSLRRCIIHCPWRLRGSS